MRQVSAILLHNTKSTKMLKLYPAKMPFLVPFIFPSLTYAKPDNANQIYLTFDDGPHPEITPWILMVLKKYHIKANFFCTGANIQAYPHIVKEIIAQGHQIGNHTFSHVDAWRTSHKKYIHEISETDRLLQTAGISSKLFRPPYGRLTPGLIKKIQSLNKEIEIVMWSILMGDFSRFFVPDYAISYLSHHIKAGDILVFHDNAHSFPRLKQVLDPVINTLLTKGYRFATL